MRDITDAEALEIQLVENKQREDLNALDEAVGYEELMKVGKMTAEQVADRVGLSKSWVYSRLNLLKLDGAAREALEDGRLDVSRALVVASVAQPNQRAEALGMALLRGHNDKPMYSVRELRHRIVGEKLSMQLTGAPFPTDDATLVPNRGACGGCQYRSENCDPEALDPNVCTDLPCFHLKVKAQAERVRQKAAADGRKILRGEDARKVSPSVKTCYGHVDLDNICEWDDFPEPEPTLPKDWDPEGDEVHPLELAWRERETLWQPRTFRALLEGNTYKSVLIEDPKTHALRELVPFGEAQKILKKRGINLPSYANKKRQSFQRSGGSTPAASPKEPTPEQREKAEKAAAAAELEAAIAAAYVGTLGDEIRKKGTGALDRDDLAAIAELIGDDYDVTESLQMLGYKKLPAFAKLSEPDLRAFIRIAIIAREFYDVDEATKPVEALAKQLKVDVKKIRTQIESRPEFKVKAAPPPAAKKKGGKR